ncbi:hypothetical protein OG21DRAFT_1410030, partial [Imleria badia]
PYCTKCPDILETVKCYLLECPQYAQEHASLERNLQRATNDILFLLSDTAVTPFLLNFVNTTKCFRPSPGDVATHTQQAD